MLSFSFRLLCILFLLPGYNHAQAPTPLATAFVAFGPLPQLNGPGTDPLRSLHKPLHQLLPQLSTFPSEAASGGLASWRPCSFDKSDASVLCPFHDADPALPYTAWAVANISVTQHVRHSQILRSSQPFILVAHPSVPDGAPNISTCQPDVYQDARLLCVLRLKPGNYSVFVELSGRQNSTSFTVVYFRSPRAVVSPLLPLNHTVVPHVIVKHNPFFARLAGAHMSVDLLNTHFSEWATAGYAVLTSAHAGISLQSHSTSDALYPLPRLAPRQSRALRIDFTTSSNFLAAIPLPSIVSLLLHVTYQFGDGQATVVFNVSLPVHIWPHMHTYTFTYVDADSSIQAAAALPPASPCTDLAGCPVLLSIHGAGVDATADAWTQAYKTQNQSWTILPTGRRRYGLNWEGAQMYSARTALRVFANTLPGVPPEEHKFWAARQDMWLQAGHNIGGHGALLLATHFPDLIVAALPAMARSRLSVYDQDHGFDEQLSFSDAGGRALLRVAQEQYAPDLYHENLLGIPFMARVASKDQNVPPSDLRRFCRLLRENEFFHNFTTSHVSLSEVDGHDHWFDGVVDDNEVQTFIEQHLVITRKPRLPRLFSVFTMNPGTSGSRGGLRILQLVVPFEQSRLRVRRDGMETDTWWIETENVKRFRYQTVSDLLERPIQLMIDANKVVVSVERKVLKNQERYMDFCIVERSTSGGKVWGKCSDTNSFGTKRNLERGPDNSGPMNQVLLQRKLIIVYPEHDQELLERCVEYANILYLYGISAQVTTDSAVSIRQRMVGSDANLVVIGDGRINRMAEDLASSEFTADVKFKESGFCVSARCFHESGTGIAFLAGGPHRILVAFVAGTDREGLLAAFDLLPRSTRSIGAEWMVVSAKRGWGYRGIGGAVGFGFWGTRWSVRGGRTYPLEFFDETGTVEEREEWWRGTALPAVTNALLLVVGVIFGYFLGRRGLGYFKTGSSCDIFGILETSNKRKGNATTENEKLLEAIENGE